MIFLTRQLGDRYERPGERIAIGLTKESDFQAFAVMAQVLSASRLCCAYLLQSFVDYYELATAERFGPGGPRL